MHLIDRYILRQFLANFAILFGLLFLFAAGIDTTLNLDEFVRAGGDRATGFLARAWAVLALMADFQFPRLFLFYSYMHGLVAIGAMAFTLAQMHRYRELVALLASGVSLQRLAFPFLVGVFAVSLLQLLNQELVLYRVAPLLLRGHADVGDEGIENFPVRFTDDGRGNLWQAPSFDPVTSTVEHPTILQRDEQGRTVRRITAAEAVWDEQLRGWHLRDGVAQTIGGPEGSDRVTQRTAVEFYESDLDPRAITIRRYGEYAAMLSLRQIQQMLDSPRLADVPTLLRHRYARFAMIAVNVLVLFISLPAFLLREPANLMRQSLVCAALSIPALFGAVLGMMVPLPGIAPAVGVFLPVIVLIPMAAARWTTLRS